MDKTYYSKLIRDKIPEVITKSGGKYEVRILKEKEFEKELKKKLVEEAKEVGKASKKEIVNELSDILEIIKSISEYHKLNFKQIEKYQAKKRKERGGFKKKLFLVWSSEK